VLVWAFGSAGIPLVSSVAVCSPISVAGVSISVISRSVRPWIHHHARTEHSISKWHASEWHSHKWHSSKRHAHKWHPHKRHSESERHASKSKGHSEFEWTTPIHEGISKTASPSVTAKESMSSSPQYSHVLSSNENSRGLTILEFGLGSVVLFGLLLNLIT